MQRRREPGARARRSGPPSARMRRTGDHDIFWCGLRHAPVRNVPLRDAGRFSAASCVRGSGAPAPELRASGCTAPRPSDRGGHDELPHNRVHERPHTFLYEKRRASACTLVRAHAECVPRRLLRLKRCTRRKQMCLHFCLYFLFTCPAPSFHGASLRVASSYVSGRGHCFCSAERAWVAGARAARCPGTSLAASRSPRRT